MRNRFDLTASDRVCFKRNVASANEHNFCFVFFSKKYNVSFLLFLVASFSINQRAQKSIHDFMVRCVSLSHSFSCLIRFSLALENFVAKLLGTMKQQKRRTNYWISFALANMRSQGSIASTLVSSLDSQLIPSLHDRRSIKIQIIFLSLMRFLFQFIWLKLCSRWTQLLVFTTWLIW